MSEGFDVVCEIEPATSPDLRMVRHQMASIATRLPGPSNPDARVGYIQWICTDPEWRRHGMARAVTAALIRWLRGRGVRSVELHATSEGAPLYRSLGFGDGPNPALRLRV